MRAINHTREFQLHQRVEHAVKDAASDGKISVPEASHIAAVAEDSIARSQKPHRQATRLGLDVKLSGAKVHPNGAKLIAKRTARAANRRGLVLQFQDTRKYTPSQVARLADRAMQAFDKACAQLGLDPAVTQVSLSIDRGRAPHDKERGLRDFELWVTGDLLPHVKPDAYWDPSCARVHVKTGRTGTDEISLERRPRVTGP